MADRIANGVPAGAPTLPLRKSLRARGMLATLALLAYFVAAGLDVAAERGRLNDNVQGLERVTRHEKAVALAGAALDTALAEARAAGDASAPPPELQRDMDTGADRLAALEAFDADAARVQRALARRWDALLAQPQRAQWADLRDALARAGAELDIRRAVLAERRDALVEGYRHAYDAITVRALLLGVFGVAGFGTLAAWFFARLAHDIGRLEAHAHAIVAGRRGVALAVRREDELGRLMHAVNRMAADLDEREQRLAVEGQQRSHHDKMRTLGALAAGMAHEVNNPLAVIALAAQPLRDAPDAAVAAQGALILAQAERAASAARQLAEAAAPQPADIDWFDLGALLRQTLRWLGYDKRWRGFAFELSGEAALPALRGSAEAVQQALTQWLTLACEAVAARPDAPRRVAVEADASDGATVRLCIVFQGASHPIQGDTLHRVALARATLAALDARVAIDQGATGLTHITLALPLDNLKQPAIA